MDDHSPDDARQQQELLATRRRYLAELLRQRRNLGLHAPPYLLVEIGSTRDDIRRAKAQLGALGAPAPDAPEDEAGPDETLDARAARLRSEIDEGRDFLNDRLASFVGRVDELNTIRATIAGLQPNGGYLTITGQAGQGKSSIIARLVDEYARTGDREDVIYHFIPFSPGPGHQVLLLRNLIARLILKYTLSENYLAGESYPILSAGFGNLLRELARLHIHEVIFIDGLDQLQADARGLRDLSFLPQEPPPGVVFVLGTRPNDTLEPLKLLARREEYLLPELRRTDFDAILHRRGVVLDRALADRFYDTMQRNALYLDLVAKELHEASARSPEEIIQRVADNPNQLFSFIVGPQGRLSQWERWETVGLPILRMLLVRQQPLSELALQQLINQPLALVKAAVARLGGLVVRGGDGRCSLFHLKLQEYLRRDLFAPSELAQANLELARWCGQGPGGLEGIWDDAPEDTNEPERYDYARRHYVAHLYYAGAWRELWAVLDAGAYGRHKLRHDPSTRSYALDLDLGRQAAARPGIGTGEALALLPQLWRYSLLRCSLTSRADNYPDALIEALALVGRAQEAIGLAELMTDPTRKARVLATLGLRLHDRLGRAAEGAQLLARASQIALGLARAEQRSAATEELAAALIEGGAWEIAFDTTVAVENPYQRVLLLARLVHTAVAAGAWDTIAGRAIALMSLPQPPEVQSTVVTELAQAGLVDHARELVDRIERPERRGTVQRVLALRLLERGASEAATQIAAQIGPPQQRSATFADLASAVIERGRSDAVLALVVQAAEAARQAPDDRARAYGLRRLALLALKAGERELARNLATEAADAAEAALTARATAAQPTMQEQPDRLPGGSQGQEPARSRDAMRASFVDMLTQAGLWNRAVAFAEAIETGWQQEQQVVAIIEAMLAAGELERATTLASGATNPAVREQQLARTGLGWAQAGAAERAFATAGAIESPETRVQALAEIGKTFAAAGVAEAAERAWATVEATIVAATGRQVADSGADGHTPAAHDALAARAAYVLAEAGKGARAVALATALESPELRVATLVGIGRLLVDTEAVEAARQAWAIAEATAREVDDPAQRAILLANVAQANMLAGNRDNGLALYNEVSAFVRGLYDERVRQGILLQIDRSTPGSEWPWYGRVGAALNEDEAHLAGLWYQPYGSGIAAALVIEDDQERATALQSALTEIARWNGIRLAPELPPASWPPEDAALLPWGPGGDVQPAPLRPEELLALRPTEEPEAPTPLAPVDMQPPLAEQAPSPPAFPEGDSFEQAIQQARGLLTPHERAGGLAQVARDMALAGQRADADRVCDEAARIARSIEDPRLRFAALSGVARALAETGQCERAHNLAQTIDDPLHRGRALVATAQAQTAAGRPDEARALCEEAALLAGHGADAEERANLMCTVVETYAEAGGWQRATDLARSIDERRQRSAALCALAAVVARTVGRREAEPLFRQAIEAARTIDSTHQRAAGERAVVEALAASGDLPQARELTTTITIARHRAAANAAIATALAQAGDAAGAAQLARAIEGDRQQADALGAVAGAFTRAGALAAASEYFDAALAAADRITNPRHAAETLVALGLQLSEAGREQAADDCFARAHTASQQITSQRQQAESLGGLARCLANAGRLDAALAVCDEAAAIAPTLEDPAQLAPVLRAVARALNQAQDQTRLLQLVRRAWSQATTRDELLQLMPLAGGLIREHPRLGPHLAEGFDRVSAFLGSQ